MKKIILTAAVALMALPMFAQETKKDIKTERTQQVSADGKEVTTKRKVTQSEKKGNAEIKQTHEQVVKTDVDDKSTADKKDVVVTTRKTSTTHRKVIKNNDPKQVTTTERKVVTTERKEVKGNKKAESAK